jgi:hypothetical protein
MRSVKERLFVFLIFGLSVFLLSACGDGGGGGGDGTSGISSSEAPEPSSPVTTLSTGVVSVSLTDNQTLYNAVVLTIKEIGIVSSNSDTVYYGSNDLDQLPITINVLDFPKEATIPLDDIEIDLPENGDPVCFNQIRLVLEANDKVYKNGGVCTDDLPCNNYLIENGDPTAYALKTPSGQQSGVKILTPNDFCVDEDADYVQVSIDFDPMTAINYTGNENNDKHKYILKPTGIRIIKGEWIEFAEGYIDGIVAAPVQTQADSCEKVETPLVKIAATYSVEPEDDPEAVTVALADDPVSELEAGAFCAKWCDDDVVLETCQTDCVEELLAECYYTGPYKLLLPTKDIYDLEASWSKANAEELDVKYNSTVFLKLDFDESIPDTSDWELINKHADWSPRAGLQVVQLYNSLYLMGGRTPRFPKSPPIPGDSDIWGDVWQSADNGKSWQNVLQTDDEKHWPARAYFQAVTNNEYMYVLGGQNYKLEPNFCPLGAEACPPFISASTFFNDVWRSNDGINWEEMVASAPWSGRAGLSAIVYKNEIFVMGGSYNDDAAIVGGQPIRVYLNDVWKSSDGKDWEQLTGNASWAPRAGAAVVVKDGYMYLLGGEDGFVCTAESRCPPYFNDVWRSIDGVNWELIIEEADWTPRPGHQVQVLQDRFVLYGGFGLSTNPEAPFEAANPIDVWVSEDGLQWTMLSDPPWDATTPEEVKYDFDALVIGSSIYTFGGDRETFDFSDLTNYLNVDNDVWRFTPPD